MARILYIVATPIGNLEDITLRALRVLQEVGLIAAEDTRTTRKLLTAYEIHTPLKSYNDHNRNVRIPQLMRHLEAADVALVSEAGTPVISDPGHALVRAALQQGYRVVPVPGPSVVTAALAVAGLPADSFTFVGFLPRRTGDRRKFLSAVAAEGRTLVAFETPHRLQDALADILAALGDREMTACREMTKVHEEVFRGTVSGAQRHFAQPRGEFTLVIAGRSQEKGEPVSDDVLLQALAGLLSQGLSASQACARVAREHGVPRRRAYELALSSKARVSDSRESRT